MKRRIIALVAALALAGVGTFVLVGFVQSAEERATADEELVLAYQVRSAIPKNTEGELMAQFVGEKEPVPAKLVPLGAITDLADLEGFVTAVDLIEGDILVASRFVEPNQVDQAREALPERRVDVPTGHLELPISLDAERALGGIITAGDTVAVVASFGAVPVDGDSVVVLDDDTVAIPGSAANTQTAEATHIIIENALVVEVQASTPPAFTTGEDDLVQSTVLAPTGNFVVTFALQPSDVERMVFAAEYGNIWLAAQTPDDDGPTKVVTIDGIYEDS